jgi:para-nitrobenzyl esterase
MKTWLLLSAALLAAPIAVQAQEAATDAGRVNGATADGVTAWKGIPFAAPPVGAFRWRAPQSVPKWTGVKDTTAYRNDCQQVPFPSDAAPLGTPPAEDCLYMNVWKPAAAAANAKLPVLVWIYGGGFVNGGSSPPTYAGADVASQGVVFVSFNYRVGRFGTFAHPQLTKANADGGRLGNYGTMDQVAALEWVKRNIAAFGGDPAKVTIMGESAGGMSVNTLLASTDAKGLFRGAIIMSGADPTAPADPKVGIPSVEKIGVDFAASKGIAPDDPQALTKLRALSADQVTDGLNMMALFRPAAGPPTFTMPFTDGRVNRPLAPAFASGNITKVPVMIGATSADMGGKTGMMVAGARNTAAALAKQGVPTYAYRFSYVAQSLNKDGAAGHATDIPFFLDTTDVKYLDKTTPRDLGMGKTISKYVVNFTKTGDPNGAGLPAWPKYSAANDTIMDFAANGTAVAGKDPWGAELDAVKK